MLRGVYVIVLCQFFTYLLLAWFQEWHLGCEKSFSGGHQLLLR